MEPSLNLCVHPIQVVHACDEQGQREGGECAGEAGAGAEGAEGARRDLKQLQVAAGRYGDTHQQGSEVGRDQHVEDVVPPRRVDQPGEQGTQRSTCSQSQQTQDQVRSGQVI